MVTDHVVDSEALRLYLLTDTLLNLLVLKENEDQLIVLDYHLLKTLQDVEVLLDALHAVNIQGLGIERELLIIILLLRGMHIHILPLEYL